MEKLRGGKGETDVTRTQRLMDLKGLKADEAVIVSKPSNIFYLSGYTGEGLALIARGGQAIVTDFRYVEQAGQEAPAFDTLALEGKESHLGKAYDACRTYGVKTVWFEDDELTVRSFRKAEEIFTGMELKPLRDEIETLRRIKDADELRRIEHACAISAMAFERVLPKIQEGMTERELARTLEFEMYALGAEKMGFDIIAAAGANGSKPHAVPTDYRIRKGDMITLDFGAKVQGYTADMTRTVALGEPSAQMRKVYDVVLKAQMMAQDAVKAGADCVAVDAVARDYINAQGFEGRFGHGLGHSLGIDVHEEPRLSPLSKDMLEVNQLVTVEPGVYLPGIGGVRIENTVVVEADGCRSLVTATRELIVL
ncbi:MAG: aminopeptidase P family protein [Firmicutes bacterium]|nr:aminopeptidase P family protein [Bacillota bacterium]